MVWEVTHEPIYLGYLGLAQGVPLVVFQLWGGVLADPCGALLLHSRLRLEGTVAPGHGSHMFRQLFEGLSFVAHNFTFAALIALALFNAVFGLSYVTLLPIFADWYFQAGPKGFGM